MTPSILGLTFNDLTSLYRTKPEINTSKSETDPSATPFLKFLLHLIFGNAILTLR